MRVARIRPAYYLILLVLTLLSFFLHELAHWATGELLGHTMRMSLNGAHPVSALGVSSSHSFLISAAGPAFTLLQAVIGFTLVRRRRSVYAYTLVFVACLMRFAALVVSLSHPNDEARMSLQLGWNLWLLPSLVVASLMFLTVVSSRRLRISWKTNVASYLLVSLAIAAIVFADAALG